MITIEDLSSIIDDDVLQELFIRRNDETISNVSKEDKKNLDVIYEKQHQSRQVLTDSLNNLSECSKEIKNHIIENVENHIEISAEVTAYFDEKLYKSGVLDGLSLMLEHNKTQ